MKLYELSKAYREAEDAIFTECLDIETGEIVDEVSFAKFEQVKGEWSDKAEAVAIFVKETEAEKDAVNAEASKLKQRAKVLESRAAALKDYLLHSMNEVGRARLDAPRAKVSVRAARHVEITNAAEVPAAYRKEEIVEKIEKSKIAKALRAGDDVPGCALESTPYLVIS